MIITIVYSVLNASLLIMGKSSGASFLSKLKGGLTRSGRAHKVPSRLREDDTSQGGGGVGGGDPRGGGGGGEPLEEEEVGERQSGQKNPGRVRNRRVFFDTLLYRGTF